MLAIPVDRDSSVAPGVWKVGWLSPFGGGVLRTFSRSYVCPVPCLGYGIVGDAILIDSPHKSGITRDGTQR